MDDRVADKAFAFAVRVVRMSQHLQKQTSEYVMSKQVLRSGTSIGANIQEGGAAQSKNDFIAKMAIASKEARKTMYWLRLLAETDYLNEAEAKSMQAECDELVRMPTALVKTSQGSE